jgi:ribosomal protein L37AE/L43A
MLESDTIARPSARTQCAQCGDTLIAPEWSEHVNERCVRHFWSCDACGHEFETAVYLQESAACSIMRPAEACPGISLDHSVGSDKDARRHRNPERSRAVEINHEFQHCRLLDRQLGRLCPLENPINEIGHTTV